MEIKSNKDNNKIKSLNYDYSKMNNMLGMFTTPYLGVYGQDYAFFTPIKTFYKLNPSQHLLDSLPQKLQENIFNFRKKFNVDTDYFDIATDASFVLNKFHKTNISHHLRVNAVLHPYIFYDVNSLAPNREHKTICFCALFSDENLLDYNSHYIDDAKEGDGLRVNPDYIMNDENKKEIILHDSAEGFPALSPNNMAFLMDLKNGFFSFYLMAVSTYGNKVIKLLITRFVVLMNTEVPIFKGFNRAFNSMHKSDYLYEKKNLEITSNQKNNSNKTKKIGNENNNLGEDINKIAKDDEVNFPFITPDNNLNTSGANKNNNPNPNTSNINLYKYNDINFFDKKKKLVTLSSEAIKYDLINIDGLESKIKLENFLSELFYFENLFKIVINFTRGFLVSKTYEVLSALGTKNQLIKSDSIDEFVLGLIKISFESVYFDENFELLNKNSQLNFYDIAEDEEALWAFDHENINSIPNDDGINKLNRNFNHDNKINEYYPNKFFEKKLNDLHIFNNEGDNDKKNNGKQDPNHQLIGEYGLFKFSCFMRLIFKNPSIDKFGINLFKDYLHSAKEKQNYFFLKLIDNFFVVELDKVINICNKYRVFLNEFELDVPLTPLLVKSKFKSPDIEYFEITNSELEIYSKFHKNFISSLQNDPLFQNVLDQIDLNAHLALERYCDKNPLFSLSERIKDHSKRKSSAHSKNEIMTINPEEIQEIVYDINNLEEKDIGRLFNCPFKEVFSSLVDISLNENSKAYEINKSVDKLSSNFQNYLFYKTWEKKGKVLGIHDDFGRNSFYKSKFIDPLYHLKSEEKVEMLLDIIGTIENIEE